MSDEREIITTAEMTLPVCPTPRPGDEVVWYANAKKWTGVYQGHVPTGGPRVSAFPDHQKSLPEFECVRLKDPAQRRSPNWHYLATPAAIRRPTSQESTELSRLLNRIIPPGPTYAELIDEIWGRGYEIYLVGGTVRDVISGKSTNDVDLVTSMPLVRAQPFLRDMFRGNPSIDAENGFVRLGGTPASGDPFIDLKMFCHFDLGTTNALFGCDFEHDVAHRDFACNSVYYDPVNNALIDPTGFGINDSEQRVLRMVEDGGRKTRFQLGQVAIRLFKFLTRGFSIVDSSEIRLRRECIPCVAGMNNVQRLGYLRRQLLSKIPREEWEDALNAFRAKMLDFGIREVWSEHFEPFVEDLLDDDETV